MKKTVLWFTAVLLCACLLAACGGGQASSAASTAAMASEADAGSQDAPQSKASDTIRVAAIFAGAINDGSWNETQYNGILRIGKKGAETSYMENVGDADVAEAARTYAAEGYDLVYLSTNSFQDYCTPVAADYPDTVFIQINGTELTDNFISVSVADEEQGFLQGVAAALLSETGKVGFVGGMEINPIILGSKGFQEGVDYANKEFGLSVEATRINTGNFSDVNQAKETAISLIETECDVMAPMADDASVGIMEAAEEKGVMAVASGTSLVASAPTATRLVVVKDISLTYDATYDLFTADKLHPTEVAVFGAKEGVIYLTEFSDSVSEEVKTTLEDVYKKLANGEITIDTAA